MITGNSPSTPSSTDNRTTNEVLRDQLDDFAFRIQGLEDELAEKRKENAGLKRQLAKAESEGVKAGLAEELFELWVTLNAKPRNTKLTPDRRKAINAAVKLYGEADVRKVIAQNARTPYLVYTAWRSSGNRDSFRDLADILGKGKHFDSLREMANAMPDFALSEDRMAEWHDRLFANEAVCQRIYELKGWESEVLEGLGIGFDGERLVFPVRDAEGNLIAAIRYFPGDRKKDVPKAIAVGPRGLFPAPESVDSNTIWLVEGEPDAITAHAMWLPGVAVPGASVTPGDWMKRLSGRKVVICFDCDHAGRQAANRIARPLTQFAAEVKVIDMDPTRADGFDLTDWYRQGRQRKTLEEMVRLAKPVSRVSTPSLLPQQNFRSNPNDHDALFDDFVRCLEAKDCDPKESAGGQWTARCPAHDDRVPTLHLKRGEDTPVVAHCKAGCPWPEIKNALGWPTRKEW